MAEQSKFFESTVDKRTVLLRENAQQYEAILKQETVVYQKSVDEKIKLETELQEKIKSLRKAGLNNEANLLKNSLKQLTQERIQAEEQLQSARVFKHADAQRIMQIYETNQYKRMNAQQKRDYSAKVAEDLRVNKRARDQQYAELQREWKKQDAASKQRAKKGASDAEKQAAANARAKASIEKKELEKAMAANRAEDKQMKDAEDVSKSFSKLELFASKEAREKRRDTMYDAATRRVDEASAAVSAAKATQDYITSSATSDKELKKLEKIKNLQSKMRDAESRGDKEELNRLQKKLDRETKNFEIGQQYADALAAEAEANHELALAQEEEKKAALKKAFDPAELGMAALSKAADNISGHLNDIYGSQGRMKGRLQGSGVNWGLSLLDVTTNVGVSGLVSQKKIVKKMEELVDSGVAYNLELRAFLAETSENIASTFDAANGTLLRMIRLQQADTTTARLGMEAMLTKLFNEYFKDTSYLTQSGPSDAITSAIMDASATMGRDQSLEFEFTVQKWLGSLYSLGMSAEAVQQIAEGINYLGTGNVTALNNNPALQTLFAMSASRAGGKSYAQMLTTGLTNEDTNKLLRAMIEYLAQIAESQTNYVTKAAYADLFNMSITDLSTFQSLTTKEIENLFKTNTDYKALTKETETQLRQVITRVSMAQMLDTVIENAEVGAASLIGSNPLTYGTWKALSILKDYVGKIELPGITAAGFGLASGMDLLNLAQTAMAGLGLVGSLISGVASMAQGGAMNLNTWTYDEYTQRGGGLSILNAGSTETTSYSAMIGAGGGSGEDIETVTMESGKDKGNEAAGTSSEEMEEQKEIPQKIYEALAGDTTPTVLSLLQEIDDRLDPGRVFYTAISGVLSRDTVSQVTNLSAQLATAKATIESTNEQGSNSNEQTKGATGGIVSGGTQGQTPSNENSQALSGNGSSPLDGAAIDLSSMITDAVTTALNNVLVSNTYSGIPVRVTNGG